MNQTATNPGLQAALEAYNVLHAACEQAKAILESASHSVFPLSHVQAAALYQNLSTEMAAADKILDEYVNETLNEGVLEQIIDKHLGPDDVKASVEAMDLEAVLRYARENNIGDWDTSEWLDDMWPEKESELRAAVAQHMMGEEESCPTQQPS